MSHTAAFFSQQLNFSSHTDFTISESTSADINTDIDVYLFNSNTIDCDQLAELTARYLHPDELAVYSKRKQLQAKQEYLASRFIIKRYASQRLNYDFDSMRVQFDEKNTCLKVYHQDIAIPLHCCISHSHGQVLVACAVTSLATVATKNTSATNTINLGVDLEWISTKRSLDRVAKHYYHDAELNACIAHATSHSGNQVTSHLGDIETLDKGLYSKALYRIWTLKEALAKAIKQPIAKLLRDNVFEHCQPLQVQSGCYADNELTFDVSIISDIKGADNTAISTEVKVLTALFNQDLRNVK